MRYCCGAQRSFTIHIVDFTNQVYQIIISKFFLNLENFQFKILQVFFTHVKTLSKIFLFNFKRFYDSIEKRKEKDSQFKKNISIILGSITSDKRF